MKRKAWVSQLKRHVDQYGADNAAWYCNWLDPDGRRRAKSCGTGPKGKKVAEALADKTHAELMTGTYDSAKGMTWEKFRVRYTSKVIGAMSPQSAVVAITSLDTFERIIHPGRLDRITAETIDEFKAKRCAEPIRCGGLRDKTTGELPKRKKPGRTISAATVNRELRYIRMALRTAAEWELLAKPPRIRMIREPKRLPTFIPEPHFAAIYGAVEKATVPANVPNVTPGDWWRGLLVFGYMTGWRIGQILALRWADVNLEEGFAITRAADNKGKRDMRVPLHPLVVEHLRKLTASFDERVFPWSPRVAELWHAFVRIQKATTLLDGSPLPKGGRSGGWYGFHDLRRAFATMNAAGLSMLQLQSLMQHQDLSTTRKYVNMAEQLRPAVDKLFVPSLRKSAATG
jgi:integrase